MSKVSVVIPARNEPHLRRTIEDLYVKVAGDIEVIAVLDGYWPGDEIKQPFKGNPIFLHNQESLGMRGSITVGVQIAKGEYILKCDAHCMFGEGFDEILKADCDDNWIVIPRRYSLDAEKWECKPKPPIDYHYLSYPYGEDKGLHGRPWYERAKHRSDILIDDEMSSQGSAWFMSRRHWHNIGGMPEFGYGRFTAEFQQLGLTTWLGGGAVKVNKRTWYAHWHKSGGRGYPLGKREVDQGAHYCTDFWMNNRWKMRKHNMEWLIAKFWPVPGWPESFDPSKTPIADARLKALIDSGR